MWFPHAFMGVMEQLQWAIKQGETPMLNGRDNLRTMAVVEAAQGLQVALAGGPAVAVGLPGGAVVEVAQVGDVVRGTRHRM